MDTHKRGHGLLASLWGAAGVFIVGFFGAEALFAPASEGMSVEATLIPSGLAALGMFVHLMTERRFESKTSSEGVRRLAPVPDPADRPKAPDPRLGTHAA